MKQVNPGFRARVAGKRLIDSVAQRTRGATDLSKTIVVSGSPRSGTTWMMEILMTLAGYRSVFEPLNAYTFPSVCTLSLPPRIYIPPTSKHEQLQRHIERALDGRLASSVPVYPLTAEGVWGRMTARAVIAKFINANRILPWLSRTFQLRRTFMVIRHPCAAIASQLKTGWTGYPLSVEAGLRKGNVDLLRQTVLSGLAAVPALEQRSDVLAAAERADTIEQLLAIEWALDYHIPLSDAASPDWHLVAYESFVTNGEETVSRIFAALGEHVPPRARDRLRKPSTTSRQNEIDARAQLLKWQQQLSAQQTRAILDTVRLFGPSFYSEEPEPDYAALSSALSNR